MISRSAHSGHTRRRRKQKPHQWGMLPAPQKNNDLPPCIHEVECGGHIEETAVRRMDVPALGMVPLQGFAPRNGCSDEASESKASHAKGPRLMQHDMGAGWRREMPQSIPRMLHADQGSPGSRLRSRLPGNGNELHLRLAARSRMPRSPPAWRAESLGIKERESHGTATYSALLHY